MKTITLTQNQFALVDDADYEFLNQWKWYAFRAGNKWYAARTSKRDSITKKQTTIWIHRVINNTPAGLDTDHVDGNGLNNQKSNLRSVTGSQNQGNTGKRRDNTSGFKGVTWDKHANKYTAQIRFNKEHIYLGLFTDPVDAARAYDSKALEIFGDFAQTNF